MKKEKILFILPFILLASCQSNKESTNSETTNSTDKISETSKPTTEKETTKIETDLNSVFSKYENSFKVTGAIYEYLKDSKSASSVIDFNTRFTENSFHHDRTVENESGSVDYFKLTENNMDYCGAYEIDADNKPVLSKVTSEDGDYVYWNLASNPFLDTTSDSAFFEKQDENTFYLDFTKDANNSGNRITAAKNFLSKLAVFSLKSFNSFTVTIENDLIKSFNIESSTLIDSSTKEEFYYKIEINFEMDETKDYTADILKPYEHKDYHDNLKAAFTSLFNNPYSFTRTVTGSATTLIPTLNGYVDSSMYFISAGDDNIDGLIMIDNKCHEILLEDNTYYYDEEVKKVNSVELTSIENYLPQRSEAVEAFILDTTTNSYVLDTEYASRFSFYFDTFGDYDTNYYQEDATKVNLYLNTDNTFSKIEFTNDNNVKVTYTFKYDTSNLPFNKNEIQAYDKATKLLGNYTGTFTDGFTLNDTSDITLSYTKKVNTDKYSKDKYVYNVILNGYTAINLSLYNNILSFEISQYNFQLFIENNNYILSVEDSTSSDPAKEYQLTKE